MTKARRFYTGGAVMLSNLNHETFTIINQIPQAPNVATKTAWKKHTLKNCDKKSGVYDKSSGTMFFKANSFTAYISQWQEYKNPDWFSNGFYALADEDKNKYFTANVGDFIIFADIPDETPTTTAEFVALTQKYKEIGGIIEGVNVFINYHPNGTPWETNHIEIVRG